MRKQKRSEFISIRTSSTVKEKLEGLANLEKRPLSWFINDILEQFLRDKQTSDQPE